MEPQPKRSLMRSETDRRILILFLVERGWQAARELSLDLQQEGVVVVHLIKGRLDRSVRHLIMPKSHIRLLSVDRRLFWPAAWGLLLWWGCIGRLRALLVDNDRSYRRFQRWAHVARLKLAMVRQGAHGYEVWVGAERVPEVSWRSSVGLA